MNDLFPEYKSTLPATPQQQRIAALRQRVTEIPLFDIWSPEPGNSLVGCYAGYQTVEHPKYGTQFQILIRDEHDKVTAVWANTWIRNNLKAQGLAMGDFVAITYLGQRPLAAGGYYKAYSIVVDKLNNG